MKIKEYKEKDYLIIFGVKKTFVKMLEIVDNQYKLDHRTGGRNSFITPQERLEITLKYLRQYVSQRYLAQEYEIAKSCISPIIKWTMKTIIHNSNFSLPNRVKNISDNSEARIIDVTETKIDRPKKHQEDYYSGKKKIHSLKTQVEIGLTTKLIYSLAFEKGHVHDFALFKNAKHDYNENTTELVDKGYLGIDKIHPNSILPLKASKYHVLSEEEKWYNSEISKLRIAIEHVNAYIKKFKIFSTRFRNRRKNFKLYMSLICGIYNFELVTY